MPRGRVACIVAALVALLLLTLWAPRFISSTMEQPPSTEAELPQQEQQQQDENKGTSPSVPSCYQYAPRPVVQPCPGKPNCHERSVLTLPCLPSTVFHVKPWWDWCSAATVLKKPLYSMLHPDTDVAWSNGQTLEGLLNVTPVGLREAWRSAAVRNQRRIDAEKEAPPPPQQKAKQRTPYSGDDAGVLAFERDGLLRRCPATAERQVVVGFAARYMRPFQVISFVKSLYQAMWHDRRKGGKNESQEEDDVGGNKNATERRGCSRLHLFVQSMSHPMWLHLQAVTTPGYENAYDKTPSQLAADAGFLQANSFLVLEDYPTLFAALKQSKKIGNNERPEVVRIAVAEWWVRHSRGQLYDSFLFSDTRDVVFVHQPFRSLREHLRRRPPHPADHGGSEGTESSSRRSSSSSSSSFVFAAAEEFPLLPMDRDGIHWNMEVHSAVFSPPLLQRMITDVHLGQSPPESVPMMRLINSGVWGGTRDAVTDLLEVWGPSTAAVHTETFGIDQPLLGGLMYFGLKAVKYPHQVLLLDQATGPLRHLYPDAGEKGAETYQYIRLGVMGAMDRSPSSWSSASRASRMLMLGGNVFEARQVLSAFRSPLSSEEGNRDLALPPPSPPHAGGATPPSEVTTTILTPLNCEGEPYAILHQLNRYDWLWEWLTMPTEGPTIEWAKRHRVEFTWPAKSPKGKRKSINQ